MKLNIRRIHQMQCSMIILCNRSARKCYALLIAKFMPAVKIKITESGNDRNTCVCCQACVYLCLCRMLQNFSSISWNAAVMP